MENEEATSIHTKIRWLSGIIIAAAVICCTFAVFTYRIDPFFHYHKPDPDLHYERTSDYERYENDGVIRHFDYDSVIVGNSLVGGFVPKWFDELFGIHTVKVSNSGGTEREFAEYIRRAEKVKGNQLKYVFFEIDPGKINRDKNARREDITDWPDYLYDDNAFDDLNYLLNKHVIFNIAYNVLKNTSDGAAPGVYPDDEDPGPFQIREREDYGNHSLIDAGVPFTAPEAEVNVSEGERKKIISNLSCNLVDVVNASPNTQFYFFMPPISIAERARWWSEGTLTEHFEEEELLWKSLMDLPNVHLFSWNNDTDITLDYTQYMDVLHYGPWFYDQILLDMKNGDYELTSSNLDQYLAEEKRLYSNYDYVGLNDCLDEAN